MSGKLLAGFALLLVAGVAAGQGFGLALSINGVGISRAKIQAQTDHLINQRGLASGGLTQPSAFRKIQEEIVEQVVVQELLWQEAQRRGIVVGDDEVDAEFEALKANFDTELAFRFKIEEGGFTEVSFRDNIREQMSVQRMIANDIRATINVGDAEVRQYYEQNIDRMQQPERVRARHILVKFDADDEASRAAAEKKLGAIRARLDEGEKFALLAVEASEGPSSSRGGDLGFFERGQMVPEFERAAFDADEGSVVGPVETPFGLHLIEVEQHVPADVAPFDSVAPQIRDYLAQQALLGAIETLVEDLRASAEISNNLW